MMNSIIKLLFLGILFGSPQGLWAEPTAAAEAPWDTVVAKLQIIESMKTPDSLKTLLTQELFSEHHLTAEEYGKFFDQFLRESPEKQLEFLKRVENIILEMIKQQQQPIRRE